jgi:hypothetical protein
VDEERLREIGLDARLLMMNIVIICVVPKHDLQWVKGKAVPAMIVYGFERREREEENCLSDCQERNFVGDGCTTRVQ